MSLSIESLHDHNEEIEQGGGQTSQAPSILKSLQTIESLVTKDHIDKVDLEIEMLYKKAETVIIDQNHQREKQK
jgi:hypothetical protein